MPDQMNVDVLQQRLQAWAAWLTGGGSGSGYPTKSVLHSSWLPPTPGTTPTMKANTGGAGQRERELHRIIGSLSVRLQNTLVVVYVMRASAAEQVVLLDCQASTVRARVAEAKRLVSMALHAHGSGGTVH